MTSGVTDVDVGGVEVMTVGTWLSGLPVAVTGREAKDDFTTDVNVYAADVVDSAGSLGATSLVSMSGSADAIGGSDSLGTGVSMSLDWVAGPLASGTAVAVPLEGEPIGTVDEGWKSNPGMVAVSIADAVVVAGEDATEDSTGDSITGGAELAGAELVVAI